MEEMTMRFEVYSLNKVLKEADKCPGCNLISIRDVVFDDENNAKYACLDRRAARNNISMLKLWFDDIDPYRYKCGLEHRSVVERIQTTGGVPRFFTDEMAKGIVDWTMDIWKKDKNATVKIHCWAGRSRSQAVAYWLNIYFNLVLDRNLNDYVANNALNVTEKVHFNCEVLRVFTSVFG